MNDYKQITVRDIINEVTGDRIVYPNGLDTVVMTGDFEGNYTHKLHAFQIENHRLVLGYEMHEGQN